MLPLWIIDLTQSSGRRARFTELLGQTNYVFFFQHDDNSDSSVADKEYRWMYTHYDLTQDLQELPFDLSECTNEKVQAYSEHIYRFQNDLVRDGQEYVRMIRHSSLHAYTSLNICVLGDSTERFTQLLFSSIALLLQKEKGRMLANHIHQGMSVYGALFVPSNINSNEVQNRERVLRTLMEIDIEHRLSTVRGYDHVLLFQDVQNRVEKYYRLLSDKGQAEFLYQTLIHLYYACNTQHPLISGVAAADSFYLSIGAASISFDDSHQDMEDSCIVSNALLEQFYALPKNDDAYENSSERENKREFISFNEISPDKILNTFQPENINLEVSPKDPFPDPISNFADKHLKRRYFNHYLPNRLAEFRRLMNDEVEKATRAKLEWVHATFNKSLNVLQETKFPEGIRRFLERCNSNDGGLFFLETQLKSLKEEAAELKKRTPLYVESHVWENVYQFVPSNFSDDFHNYHAAYVQDSDSKALGHACDDLKSVAIDDLCNHLKQETPLSSRIIRSLLLGIVSVVFTLPLLNLISPGLINLGSIRQTALIWAVVLFCVPAVCEFFMAIRYLVKRERKERKLRAYYLHDAYARIANRILSESGNYYNQIMRLCDMYLSRSELIRLEIHDLPIPQKDREELPETQFNQHLVGGSFHGHKLLTPFDIEPKKILINHIPKEVLHLYPSDYYSLIHLLKECFQSLFTGIRVPEDHPYVIDKSTGTVRMLSIEEVKQLRANEWESIREGFKSNLPELIKEELVPLQHPSVSGVLAQYIKKVQSSTILSPFVCYAATNGEFTTSADCDNIDVKTFDDQLIKKFESRFPQGINFQVEPGGEDDESIEAASLYKKYIFLTRWIGYEELALNRILPLEDFDIEEQKRQINEEQRSGKKRTSANANIPDSSNVLGCEYPVATSSTILWSLCEGDNSVLWLKLFHAIALPQAREKSAIIYNKLTTKD